MVKSGTVFATATEDMDALTFGSNILLRNLTASEARWLFGIDDKGLLPIYVITSYYHSENYQSGKSILIEH